MICYANTKGGDVLYDDDYDGYDEAQLQQILLYEISEGNNNRRRPLYRIIKENTLSPKSSHKLPRIPNLAYSWTNFRRKIKKRDGDVCTECGIQGRLEVHHILPVVDSPEQALDEGNCTLLCHECHMEKHHGE